ncbi:MAG: proline dehydrogenase family protein, partial [Candidatus Sulfotelmatobacter sp.]
MLRAFFVRLSENQSLRSFAERSSLGRRVSGRFVAGTEIADAVRATQAINRVGMSVSIDNLGENVTNPAEARHSAQLYHQILDAIIANQLNANISLKLTHMGLDVDEQLAREIVIGLVAKAASMTPPGFIRVDMEGSPYTQRTLDFVHELHRIPGNANSVGTVIQSYLKRSESDVEKLLAEKIRIRLCKGAYKESADIAFAAKSEVDANYVKLMKILMKSGVYHGLATHDENIVRQAQAFA